MTKTLTYLAVSTALTTAVVLPAWSAVADVDTYVRGASETYIQSDTKPGFLILTSDDDDDNHRHKGNRRHHDDDDDEEEDDCDDGKTCEGIARNPVSSDTVNPPKNGLFENGSVPRVQMK